MLFFSSMESQGRLYKWTSPGYYRLHSGATSEQHGLQSKLGVEGGRLLHASEVHTVKVLLCEISS